MRRGRGGAGGFADGSSGSSGSTGSGPGQGLELSPQPPPARCSGCWRASDIAARAPQLLACRLLCARCGEMATGQPAAEPCSDAGLSLQRDLQRLAARRRAGLLRALDAATRLKLRLEAELTAAPEPAAEPDRLRALHADAVLQARLDELVRQATTPLDLEALRRAVDEAAAPAPPDAGGEVDPLVYLSNYCMAALFLRGCSSVASPPASPWPTRPLYYFEVSVGGLAAGRVVVGVRTDAAPRMARNFGLLATGRGARGAGYTGCAVFQCWEGESVITGDVERNDGRGRAERGFVPDESRLAAVRGAVGMRRSQRRHDQRGLVGSQFRIVLREMRGFSAIFGAVVDGLALVDRLSRTGDSAGKPASAIIIESCGRLD